MLLPNCPVTRKDIVMTDDIFGPNVDTIKEKTVRQKKNLVQSPYSSIPHSILSKHSRVTLIADFMFVNQIPFLITRSRVIKMNTVENTGATKCNEALKALKTQ